MIEGYDIRRRKIEGEKRVKDKYWIRWKKKVEGECIDIMRKEERKLEIEENEVKENKIVI